MRLARMLFPDSDGQERFVDAINSGHSALPSLLWLKPRPEILPFSEQERPLCFPDFVSIPSPEIRPGKLSLHQEGYYYCLDGSSIFEAAPFMTVAPHLETVIDLCASPGGKTLCAWRALRPSRLIANEVIGKRTAQLRSNLTRCGAVDVEVSSNDVSLFAELADLVIVDAPCTGQSLIARGEESSGSFLPHVIKFNAMRQRRILINAAKLVRPGGYLAYMTCTYSIQENEEVVEWLIKRDSELDCLPVPVLESFRSTLSEYPMYRLWPFQGLGAGGFTVLMRRKGDTTSL